MKFRTEVFPKSPAFKMHRNSRILFIGSCFSNEMGKRLEFLKYKVNHTLFGVVFNPLSIFSLLNEKPLSKSDIIENQGIWYHWQLNANPYSSVDKLELEGKIDQLSEAKKLKLDNAEVVVITLGTAWTYFHKQSKSYVGNCHKVSADAFEKQLLEVDEIVQAFQAWFDEIKVKKPSLKVILSVSPVRHVKDTLELNTLSKSILRVASHKICTQNEHVVYFPSYEILMDDLRDYRFYESDLIHPNEMAVEYIWQKFAETFFMPDEIEMQEKLKALLISLEHKIQHPKSASFLVWQKAILKRLEEFEKQYEIALSKEKQKLLAST